MERRPLHHVSLAEATTVTGLINDRTSDWEDRMLARPTTFGIFAAMALALPPSRAPFFTLGAGGAVNLAVTSDEARFGMSPVDVEGAPLLTISLGATSAAGSLSLSISGDRLPAKGRYPVRPWEDRMASRPQFEALFVAGSPDHPLGAFRGEFGWVTITEVEPGRISGVFEVEGRGFVASDMNDEDRWVSVRGRFEAQGDSTITSGQALSASM
jgi:hypothetical protein